MGFFDILFHRGNDLTSQFLPDALFFRDSILSGKFPIWNPWIFGGIPYLLDPQNFLWYPPNYLLLLFSSIDLGFLALLIGHLIFAGYFLRRLLNAYPRWIQIFGIVLYLLSPKLISHLEEGNWTLVIAATWIPALYWSLVNQRFWWTAVSLSALIINNLNIGYYAVLFVVLFFFIHRESRERTVLPYGRTVLFKILIFSLLLTLPRWLPLMLWGDQTVRASLSEAPLPFWGWTKIAKSFVVPLAPGHPQLQNEEILYVGIIPILLLIWAIAKGLTSDTQGQTLRNSATKGRSLQGPSYVGPSFSIRFWTVWLIFILFVALNIKTPFFSLVKLLPGFSLLRTTTRPWIFVSLFVALATPIALFQLSKRSKLLAIIGVLGILGEFGIFGYKLFDRRVVQADPLPRRFYERMIHEGIPTRAYCTTGCIDRLTAQKMGIALLHGNNPIQLTQFVNYLQEAGGYRESSYHPILPPYTVFNQAPQPNAELLGKTATKFVVSLYELTDSHFFLVDQEGEYRLYRNEATAMEVKDHFFELK